MKKSIFIAVLGIAACAVTSYGQGSVGFTSYSSNDGAGTATTIFGSANAIPDGYTADLYYFLGTVSDPVNAALATSITAAPTGLTDLGVTGVTYSGGYFSGGVVTIPGYASGPVTFEVVAYNGSSYATSTIRGRSGSFTMSGIATGLAAVTNLGDGADNFAAFQVATVTAVPEPTTLALAGLGGLASLVAIRRKKV